MAKQSSIRLHKFLPHHALSILVGWLAECRWLWFKNRFIAWFIKHYGVDMTQAHPVDYRHYPTFNAFFTRHLKPDARPIDTNPDAIISPVDGGVSELGQLNNDRMLQAKGKFYDLTTLLGGCDDYAQPFQEGSFLTAYLAPKDYHRIHMPIDGRLLAMIHVPGRLFSVNAVSVAHIDNVFARNERVVCLFETPIGPMAMVIIGAMLVGSIVTVWHGQVTPPTRKAVHCFNYRNENIEFKRGDEIGHFKMGSSVIVLFSKNAIQWNENLQHNSTLKLGRRIATKPSK